MHEVSTILLLLAVVAVTNGATRAVRVPLPLLQIAAGAFLARPLGVHLEIEPEVFLLVFIPPLLFIDGFRIPKNEFRRFRRPILMMAFGLVVVTVVGLGFLVHACIPGIPIAVAFAIASALSPTDAVAVAGITGRVKVPPSLMHLLQGEALFNDASGLVCLRVAVAAATTASFVAWKAAGSLVLVAGGGLLVGAAIAWLLAGFQRLVFGVGEGTPGGRILLVLVLPYAGYLVAEHFHLSGILAAAAAGMLLPRLEIFGVAERAARRESTTVLDAVELSLNGLVFVILGQKLPAIVASTDAVVATAELQSWKTVVATAIAITIGLFVLRFAWVWVSMRITVYRSERRGESAPTIPLRVVVATALAGVRGAVSLAAALTIPAVVAGPRGDYPARDVAVLVAAFVIVLSLVSASVGLPFVLSGIALPPTSSDTDKKENLLADLAETAIAAIERARDERPPTAEAPSELVADAAQGVLEAYRARTAASDDRAVERERTAIARELYRVGIAAERTQLRDMWKARTVDDETYRAILHRLDAVEETLVDAPTGHGHG